MSKQEEKKLFSKSAFKVALRCPPALYYCRDPKTYDSQNNGDEFLQALAESGFLAGDLAKIYCKVADAREGDDSEDGGETVASGGAAFLEYGMMQSTDGVDTEPLTKAQLCHCEFDALAKVFV